MENDERVIDGVLCYWLKDRFIPYTSEQLTKFLLRAEEQIDGDKNVQH